MQVKDIMTPKVISVKANASVAEIVKLLTTHQINGVPVVDDNNIVLGLISEKEMFATDSKIHIPTYVHLLRETKFVMGSNKELPYVESQIVKLKASDILNKETFLAQPEMELENLVEIFVSKGQNPVIVTDSEKHLVGIVSRSDLLKTMMTKYSLNYSPSSDTRRPVDKELEYVRKDLSSRFSYVSKARANIWLTVAITLMIVGFVAGIIYTVDPNVVIWKQTNQE